MKDIHGMPLKVGDSVKTSQGVCEILALLAGDNGSQGELVRVKNAKGQRTDMRLKLAQAEYISPNKPTGFKLGDMVHMSLTNKRSVA